MGPRSLLRFDLLALVVALVGAGVIHAPAVFGVFVLGAIAGAVVALAVAWHELTPPMRALVRGFVLGRLDRARR